MFGINEITERTILARADNVYDPTRLMCSVLFLLKYCYRISGKLVFLEILKLMEKKRKFLNWFKDLFHFREISIL